MLDWLPANISTFGGDIDYFFYIIYYITAAVFFLVIATLIYFLVRYRFNPNRKARYYHGNTKLEIIWTSVTFVSLLILALATQPLWSKIKQEIQQSEIQIKVSGKQFNWEVLYPGMDNIFGTEDDYKIDNNVHVPVNKVVNIILSSQDVIHSFFVPNLRLKQDAIPGREITVWFEATKTGKYEIPCAELCGFGHSGMLGFLYVQTQEEYDQWKTSTWPQPEMEQ